MRQILGIKFKKLETILEVSLDKFNIHRSVHR